MHCHKQKNEERVDCSNTEGKKKKTCEDGCLLVENGKERFKLVNESFG